MSALDKIHGAVGRAIDGVAGAWWSLAPYPPEWRDPRRLEPWEAEHADPASGVWAAYWRGNNTWELYRPGSPYALLWFNASDPYLDHPPQRMHLDRAIDLPLQPNDRVYLQKCIEQFVGDRVLDLADGLRHHDDGADLVVYVRIES